MKKNILGILFFLFFSTTIIYGQSSIDSLVIDTIKIANRSILIKIPDLSFKCKQVFNYAEGCFIDYPFIDTAILFIHYGALQELPFYKTYSKCRLQEETDKNNVVSYKGNFGTNYFREDYHSRYDISIVYLNISSEYVALFNSIMDDIIIYRNGE